MPDEGLYNVLVDVSAALERIADALERIADRLDVMEND